MRVTIHIASRDRTSELAINLHSLRKQSFQDFDVFILDNAYGTPLVQGSKFFQDIVGRLREEGHGVKIIRDDVSNGVCRARQRMIDEDPWPENEFVLRLDDDVVLEPDYIERLVKCMGDGVGITSGVTPNFSGPDFRRETRFASPVINKIVLDAEGNVRDYHDDCGFLYVESTVLPAHQFRSNALMRRKMFGEDVSYPIGYSPVGFREELVISVKALLAGWEIRVDTGAVAWHAPCPSGGCRWPNYSELVVRDHELCLAWVKRVSDRLRGFLE